MSALNVCQLMLGASRTDCPAGTYTGTTTGGASSCIRTLAVAPLGGVPRLCASVN